MTAPRSIAVLSHARPQETDDALRHLIALAHRHELVVRLDAEESAKHPSIAAGPGVEVGAEHTDDVDIAIALGGDGTILRALRQFAGTSVPVFGVNYGEIGFLATVGRDPRRPAAFERALSGDFETLTLPAIAVEREGQG